MAENERRIVITGLGLLTPLGIGPDAYVGGLREGRGGIQELHEFPVEGLPCRSAAAVPPFDIRTLAQPKHRKAITKNLKYMARDIQLAVAAAQAGEVVHTEAIQRQLVQGGQVPHHLCARQASGRGRRTQTSSRGSHLPLHTHTAPHRTAPHCIPPLHTRTHTHLHRSRERARCPPP